VVAVAVTVKVLVAVVRVWVMVAVGVTVAVLVGVAVKVAVSPGRRVEVHVADKVALGVKVTLGVEVALRVGVKVGVIVGVVEPPTTSTESTKKTPDQVDGSTNWMPMAFRLPSSAAPPAETLAAVRVKVSQAPAVRVTSGPTNHPQLLLLMKRCAVVPAGMPEGTLIRAVMPPVALAAKVAGLDADLTFPNRIGVGDARQALPQ
jgi:hypothetical protein